MFRNLQTRWRTTEFMTSRNLYTALILYSFATMGNNFNILSPSLRDLSGRWNTTADQATLVYTYRSAGYTLGALIAGVLYTYGNRQFLLSVLLTGMGLILSVVPAFGSTAVAFPLMTLSGSTSGACDTGLNVWIIELWGSDSAPVMLALWFCFSIGSFVAPLIVAPYLSPEDSDPEPGEGSILTPFIVSGCGLLIAGIIMQVAFWASCYEKVKNKDDKDEEEKANIQDGGQIDEKSKRGKLFVAVVIVASTLLITAYNAIDACHFEFIPLYLTSPSLPDATRMTKIDASYLVSALGICGMVSRGIGVLVAFKLQPSLFLYINLTLMVVSNVILLLFSSSSVAMIWTGNILLGLSFGTFFPSIFSYTDRLINISNLVGGLFIFSSGVTSSFLPLIIGPSIDSAPVVLIYSNLALTGLCIAALGGLQVYLVYYNRTSQHKVSILG